MCDIYAHPAAILLASVGVRLLVRMCRLLVTHRADQMPPACAYLSLQQDVVLGRKTVGLIRGDILTNGFPKQQAVWARMCGYVEQQVGG